MAAPPSRRVTGPSNHDQDGDASGGELRPSDAPPQRPSSRNTASPEDICALCLGAPQDMAFTDGCCHSFCFICLAEWTKVKAECPLCKQRFNSIYHRVLSVDDYEQCYVSELQRAPESTTEYYDRRSQYPTTMTEWRRDELDMMYEEHLSHAAITAQSRGYLALYTPRGAMTSSERRALYDLDLWAVPNYSHYLDASPRIYQENTERTHRLVPWLNRELNALIPIQSRVQPAIDEVMLIIRYYDIRHPVLADALNVVLNRYVDHFVYEFYLFASSIHDMVSYDSNTVYGSRSHAYSRGDPVGRFRAALQQDRTAAQRATAGPEAPQPGPSGMAAPSQEVITVDSDSDSSDCIFVKVVKPQRQRTPVITDVMASSYDNRGLAAASPSQDHRSERSARPGSASDFAAYRGRSPEFDGVTNSLPDFHSRHEVSPVSHGSFEFRDISPAVFSESSGTGYSPSARKRSQTRN
ncbi:E3 ubiquitin-protein ligase Topors-like [Haemaphysalis longicornis]